MRRVEVTDVRRLILFFLTLSTSLLAQAAAGFDYQVRRCDRRSGIQFSHNFGAQKLGSLLESTGGGLRLVRLQQRRSAGSVRGERQAA
jgi:hypothetical protein